MTMERNYIPFTISGKSILNKLKHSVQKKFFKSNFVAQSKHSPNLEWRQFFVVCNNVCDLNQAGTFRINDSNSATHVK
jgi:hypothetical protein